MHFRTLPAIESGRFGQTEATRLVWESPKKILWIQGSEKGVGAVAAPCVAITVISPRLAPRQPQGREDKAGGHEVYAVLVDAANLVTPPLT